MSGVENLKGLFLQVSGLKYTYDPKASPGNRIISVEVDNSSLDIGRRYTVAMPSFIFKGGDGFIMFNNSKILVIVFFLKIRYNLKE